MVCNLTTGKKKYAEYEDDIQSIMAQAEGIKNDLLKMIDEDAENFLPLSKAYGLPKETDEQKAHKEQVLQDCLKVACSVPIEIVKTSYKVIDLMEQLAVKGSTLALSDVGVGVAFIRSAIAGAWLNVVININMIKDEAYIKNVRAEIEPLLAKGLERCDKIYTDVLNTLEK